MLKEFKTFIMRGNVVDMAVGVIIGGAFGKIITSLVNDVIMPPVGLLVGGLNFRDLVIQLSPPMKNGEAVVVKYGVFINQIMDFLIVAMCIFLLIKGISILKKRPPLPEPTEKKCPYCLMMIPIPAKKCGHCTSEVRP